jgi:hypothetical protein
MRSHVSIKQFLATVAVLVLTLVGPISAGASDEFIPGVTDSSTGVLAELENRYIPGVTDSTTGVLRELERRSAERPRAVAPATNGGDSGFPSDATAALGAALAATAAVAVLALLVSARRRRVAI